MSLSRCLGCGGIHLLLERGASVSYAERGMRAALQVKDQFIWLTPPASMGPITVADVRRATSPSDHARLVREWAEGSWAAWGAHQETIRRWTPEDF